MGLFWAAWGCLDRLPKGFGAALGLPQGFGADVLRLFVRSEIKNNVSQICYRSGAVLGHWLWGCFWHLGLFWAALGLPLEAAQGLRGCAGAALGLLWAALSCFGVALKGCPRAPGLLWSCPWAAWGLIFHLFLAVRCKIKKLSCRFVIFPGPNVCGPMRTDTKGFGRIFGLLGGGD